MAFAPAEIVIALSISISATPEMAIAFAEIVIAL
jgi:hypothetical protein